MSQETPDIPAVTLAVPDVWVTVDQAVEMVGITAERIGGAVFDGLVRADNDGNVEMGQVLATFTPAADVAAAEEPSVE